RQNRNADKAAVTSPQTISTALRHDFLRKLKTERVDDRLEQGFGAGHRGDRRAALRSGLWRGLWGSLMGIPRAERSTPVQSLEQSSSKPRYAAVRAIRRHSRNSRNSVDDGYLVARQIRRLQEQKLCCGSSFAVLTVTAMFALKKGA